MRIQHNIMAMNAYRNYNTNTSALSKNLEKLSSGYKINRAGDDAAGLAISEKMRAQITGLNAAQKNVKDGISLVKTAEGAMQEIQDMLNRMDYLATQSANGTYDDPVDRKNLQKEVEALQTEINRIADSANFNGIKLLDGSLQEGSTAKTDALKAAEEAAAAVSTAKGEAVYGKEGSFTLPAQVANNDATQASSGTILETDYKASGNPGFAVNLNGVKHVFKDVNDTTAGDDNAANFTLTVDSKKVTVTEADIAAAYQTVNGTAAKDGDTADSKVLAQALATKLNGSFADTAANNYTVSLDGETLTFTATDNLSTSPTRHYNVSINGVTGADVAASNDIFTTGALSQDAAAAGSKDATVTVKYTDADGKEQSKDITFQTGANAGASATALIAAINADDDLKDLFTAGGNNNGVTLTSKTAGANAPKVTGLEVTTEGDDKVAIVAGSTTTEGKDAYKNGTSGYTNIGTEVTVQAGTPAIDQLASTYLTVTAADIKDGTQIRIGDETYTFSIGKDSQFKDAENVVRVEDLVDGTDISGGTLTATGLDKMITKLAEVAKDNKTFTVSHTGTVGQIGVKQLAEVKDSTDMSTMENLGKFFGISQIDAEATAKNNAAAVEAAQKKADELKAAAEKAVDGKALTLQIGDTSDDFNQMKVSVGDMHVSAMGAGKLNEGTADEKEITKTIAEINIGTQEGAHEAIDVIKNAINYVSGIRGDLGAVQNRLEHTANNLSVMAENIQDAESTIRDTDIAEEMMSYTKNNILVQSAQAMLAQANAVPQGVLQLLG